MATTLPFRKMRDLSSGLAEGSHRGGQSTRKPGAERLGDSDDDAPDEDRASIVSLDSDSTNGPFFWYRVVTKFAPKPRNCHTATMVGDKMLVFGGFGGSKWFSELWSFDTSNIEWHQPELQHSARGSSTPPARYAHSAVSFRGLLYIFGGFGGADSWLADLWVLDTQRIRVRDQTKAMMAWERPTTSGHSPSARAAHSANFVGNKLYIFGGNNGSHRMNDLYSLDTQTMHWRKEICTGVVPAPRAGHASIMLPAESSSEDSNPKLLLFGGGDVTEVFNDVYVLDMELLAWSPQPTSGPKPTPRAGHCMTSLPDGNLLVWGGGSVGMVMNDLHILNTDSMTWSGSIDLKMSPEPRVGHSVCMWNSEMYVFGGGDSQSVFGDLTILDSEAVLNHTMSSQTQLSTDSSPSGLSVSAPAFSPVSASASLNFIDAQTQTSREDLPEVQECPKCREPIPTSYIEAPEAEPVELEEAFEISKSERGGEGTDGKSVEVPQGVPQTSQVSRKVFEMNARHQQLALKLSNRPSKEDLVQQNILKGNDSVTPNIHAAQERIRKRQTGGILEKKLMARPHMRQLVLHNIIPEDDEYEEHEQRLWGHIHNPLQPKNIKNRINHDQTASEGLISLEETVLKRLDNLRQGIDSLRLARTRLSRVDQDSEGVEDQERLEHYARTEIRTLEHLVMQQIQILKGKVVDGPADVVNISGQTAAKPAENPEPLRVQIPAPPPIPAHLFRGSAKVQDRQAGLGIKSALFGRKTEQHADKLLSDANHANAKSSAACTAETGDEDTKVESTDQRRLPGYEDSKRQVGGERRSSVTFETQGDEDDQDSSHGPDTNGAARMRQSASSEKSDEVNPECGGYSSDEIDPEASAAKESIETTSPKKFRNYHAVIQQQDRHHIELQLLQQQEYLQSLLMINSQALQMVQSQLPAGPSNDGGSTNEAEAVTNHPAGSESLTASVQKCEISLVVLEDGPPEVRNDLDSPALNYLRNDADSPEQDPAAAEKDKKRPARRAGRRVKRVQKVATNATKQKAFFSEAGGRNHQDAGPWPSLMHGAFVSELDFGVGGEGQGVRSKGGRRSGAVTPEELLGSDLELEQCATDVASYLSL